MKPVRLPVIILWVFLTMTLKVIGQTGYPLYKDYKIRGTITDALTKEPVNATLVFESVPDASDVYIVGSGTGNGVFEVTIRSDQKYVVEVTSDNYKPEIDTVLIGGNQSGLNFELLSVKPGQLLRLYNIYFAQGDYKILDQSLQEISELVMLLNQYPNMKIRLEGHTDRLGGRRANMELSENRVLEIKKYLVDHGINHKRVKTTAFGGSKPISSENTEESRQMNRRVEIRILSI